MSGLLRHKDGDFSHKKLLAVGFGGSALLMGFIAFFRALYHPLGDFAAIESLILGLGKLAVITAGVSGSVELVQALKSLRRKRK